MTPSNRALLSLEKGQVGECSQEKCERLPGCACGDVTSSCFRNGRQITRKKNAIDMNAKVIACHLCMNN